VRGGIGVNIQEFEKNLKVQRELRNEIINFLKSKGLTYGQALNAIKEAQSYLERTSLENKL
jgi:hypothetical protein